MSAICEPEDFGKKHEAKTFAGQRVEDTVDSLTFGILGGTAGKIVDRFFDNDSKED